MKTALGCLLSLLLLALLPLAAAAPATAKGPAGVTVDGPGVATTLEHYTRTGADVDLGSLSEASRIFDLYGTARPAAAPDVAEEDLGARYVLTWDLGGDDLVQHAYPFAEGGAWVHFLPGQEMFGRPVRSGWASTPDLTDQLVVLGARPSNPDLPEPNPDLPEELAISTQEGADSTQEGADSTQEGADSAWSTVTYGGGLLVAAGAVGWVVVALRRRVSR